MEKHYMEGGCDDGHVAAMRDSMISSTRSALVLVIVLLSCICAHHAAARALAAVDSCVVLGSTSLRNCNNPACNCQGSKSSGGTCRCTGECDITYKNCDGNQNNQANCDCSGKTIAARVAAAAPALAAPQTTASTPAPPPAAPQPKPAPPAAPARAAAPAPVPPAAASTTAVPAATEAVTYTSEPVQPSSNTGGNIGSGFLGLIPGVGAVGSAPRTTPGGVFGVPGFGIGGG